MTMINPNELRLGNIVGTGLQNASLGRITRIYEERVQVEYTAISETTGKPYVKRSYIDCQYLEGVELTSDWLERLGFDVEYTVGGWLRWQRGDFKLLDRKLPHQVPMNPVLSVHQLQNLYQSITGSELEVNI